MGRHSLHLAAQAGCHSSVLHLINTLGVSVNLQSSESHVTAMHLAAKVRYVCIIVHLYSVQHCRGKLPIRDFKVLAG